MVNYEITPSIMKSSKFAISAFILSLLILIQAITQVIDPPESTFLGPFLWYNGFFIYLFEMPLAFFFSLFNIPADSFSQYVGFPLVLPTLALIFAFLGLRGKENRKTFSIISIILIGISIALFIGVRFFGTLSHPLT